MRRAALALTLGGCNAVFGLQSTELRDAAPDIATDAPRVCPPFGTPLRVGRELQQVVRQDCTGYTTSRVIGVAAASCLETMPAYSYLPYEGAIDGVLEKFDIGLTYVDTLRLFPEGDRLFARGYSGTGQSALIYERNPDTHQWQATKEPVPTNVVSYNVGTFTTGPDRRLSLGVGNAIEEYTQGADGMWTLAQSYPVTDWMCTYVYAATLSPDGLRMLVTCYRPDNKTETLVAERAARSDKFGFPVLFDGAPQGVQMMTINDDCSKVYFSALQSVFSASLD